MTVKEDANRLQGQSYNSDDKCRLMSFIKFIVVAVGYITNY